MDNLSIMNEDGTDKARAGLLRLHDAVVRREPSRPEAALSPDELLARFRAADPTRNAACLPWLLKTYAAGGYRLEDLFKAHDTLAAFTRLRGQLPNTATIDGEIRNPRKLGSHTTLASLWSVIGPLVEAEQAKEDCSGEKVDTDRERALSQSRVIHRSSRMVIAVPMTEEASCWWGQGTQWCTAARNDNAFEEYHENAPLIIICLRKNRDLPSRKLQLYVHAGDMQFMDENDARVSPKLILERWQDLEQLLHWAVSVNGIALFYVPEPLRTEAICTDAVGSNGLALTCVPERLRTEAMCLIAVGRDGRALEYVPKPLRTEAMCLAAVEQDGIALACVPEPLRTKAICLTAVGRNGQALSYIPEPLYTEAMCLDAVRSDGYNLEFVLKILCTEAVCLAAVKQNGKALFYVPEPLRTEALCTTSVGSNGLALQDVPEPLRTEAMCLVAVGSNGQALAYVPSHLRTEVICTVAVGRDGWAIEHVPKHLRTEAIYLAAVEQDGLALAYVPEHLHTEAICKAAVGSNGLALRYVPEHLRTETICLTAVIQNRLCLGHVPKLLRTEAICLAALGGDGEEPVFVTGETNVPKSHDSVLESLEDCLNNLRVGHQETVPSIK